ncbi:unnamed protein product [Sphagnum jensenii]|uniref:Mitochondrial ribonuclease P catalytic subunit n=1 Tax=Sphagnum jensenii TaxID=128206 RepID=A0ABP0WY36_9BRYO
MKSAGVMEELKVKRRKDSVELDLQHTLEMCSKHANVMQALELYDKVVAEGSMSFDQYCFNVVLYLCSSAATDVIVLSNDQKEFCLKRGFQIYEAMKSQGVPPNEATFTAVARLAVAKGDGDLAFDMVKQMAEAKITPRLRSYSPALYTYCKHKIADKAFEVDEHMRAAGVQPEEAELEALLKLSVELGLEDKVYSLLHRLRATVREVSASTVGVVQQWFTSTAAVNAGKLNWSNLPQTNAVKEAVERGGGGWHGLGWLGKGPWEVNTSQLDEEGVCQTCGEQLVTIDLDPRETEMFAESLFKLACQREAKNNEFRKFQAWLDQHGPFDAIVDAANVALHNQNFGDGGFNFYQLNAVVNGIQKKIGSNREPLVLLHHQRTKGRAATASSAMSILKRWQNADCIYTTPTGSNDDWYWLYAAVRYKCVLVTNDEMRDHLFELLGNEFFPKWKERHQVRFTLNRKDPVFHMPPPYSIVIQESEKGSWHIPKSGGNDIAMPREWLCVTRKPEEQLSPKEPHLPRESQIHKSSESSSIRHESEECMPVAMIFSAQKVEVAEPQEQSPSLKKVRSPRRSRLPYSSTILQKLKTAERMCTEKPIDFQI